jgi:hypothetical protein
MYNDWPQITHQKPLARLCDYILERIPVRLSEGICNDEQMLAAFRENVRKLCNEIGFSTGKAGRPRKKRRGQP